MTTAATSFETDEQRWQAVCRRDPAATDAFRYGVASTGIYCRPTCAARRPNRENVRFFATSADAERAGFRACKRCRPAGEPLPLLAGVARACALLEEREDSPSTAELARAAGVSASHFHRLFKQATGVTPHEYGAAVRRRRLQEQLSSGEPVTSAVYEAGFGSGSRVYERAGELLGMTPGRYRRGGEGAVIRHAVTQTTLGPLLVAATERGLCMIAFGETEESLIAQLRERFPRAELQAGNAEFAELVAKVAARVEQPHLGGDLPLDVRGTAFQQRVWQALTRIPPGVTRTYSQLAAELGEPAAVRAVAGACAANHLAVVIPCHRVIGSRGELRGYRWGLERKRALLEREREASGS
jgi:AraC family transcriptional regulator of adaptative response/methylated-DNA-[protein]-cysteine methyltransferase